MVAWFYPGGEGSFRPRYETAAPVGLPILKVALPPKFSSRRRRRLAEKLYGRGIRRFLAAGPLWDMSPLVPISPLPLLRAKGAELVLTLLPGLPPWERRVALRGEMAGPEAWRLARDLCPRVGGLLLDFDRGEETLERRLREVYGAAPLHLGQGPAPQAAVELAPRPESLERTLRLWGEPELGSLSLLTEGPPDPELPRLPLLELLWETGRLSLEEIRVGKAADWP